MYQLPSDSRWRKPTLREEQQVFHKFMHLYNLANITGNTDHLRRCLYAMDSWSYAHRRGNGEYSDYEQNQCIYKAFWKLKEIVEDSSKK